MKIPPPILAAFFLLSLASPASAAGDDAFEKGIREAYTSYQKGDHEEVAEKLRELLKLLEDSGAEEVGRLLPELLGDWRGESLRREDLGVLGGGISLLRTYVHGERKVTVKVVKDSPLVKQLLPLIANEDLIRLANRKSHRISGETAVMEGERKMQWVVDGRILVELSGDEETGERHIVALARQLDLRSLAKMK